MNPSSGIDIRWWSHPSIQWLYFGKVCRWRVGSLITEYPDGSTPTTLLLYNPGNFQIREVGYRCPVNFVINDRCLSELIYID